MRTVFKSIKTPAIVPKLYHRVFSHDFTRFVFIGGVGFIVNLIALVILYDWLSLPIILSQIAGAEAALLSTFIGNNFWAFTHHHHIPIKKKFIKYHATAGSGILITSSTVVILVKFAAVYYPVALFIAAMIGMVWNYTMNKKVVFKHE